MIPNKIASSWLFSEMRIASHTRRHLLSFTNFPILFPTSGCKVTFQAYPPLRVDLMLVASLLGLEGRNPAGGWLSYLFTLLAIIQPSLTHFCLFIFPHPLSSQVSKEADLSLKSSDRILSIFLTCTHIQSTFPSLSSAQSPGGMRCPGVWQ